MEKVDGRKGGKIGVSLDSGTFAVLFPLLLLLFGLGFTVMIDPYIRREQRNILLIIAALCLSGTALAEEAQAVTAADYLGEWVDLDGTCNIDIDAHFYEEEADGYVISVEMVIIKCTSIGKAV